MYGPCTQKWAAARAAQPPVQIDNSGQDASHSRDRINADVGSRAVSGHAARLNLEPDETLVGYAELKLSGLGDDGGVGCDALQDCLRAEARHFLVRHRSEDQIASESELTCLLGGDHDG